MMPINTKASTVNTVQGWRAMRRHYAARSWRGAMERYAIHHGKAIAIMADDSALIIERGAMQRNGMFRLVRHQIPADRVRWHDGAADPYSA
ncbi:MULTISPECIES: hypothetical protein [unclassified Blastomonas]|jgi:hypothetical protein|uniref:hypothetical protein n=1 Tax=unclassified Blastomonas TaxID=2626550 RepID=UPI000824419E|nr:MULTISPECIES: hypothetical protein [unclassified Blastomonas]